MLFLSLATEPVDKNELDGYISEIAQGKPEGLDKLYGKTKSAVFGLSLSILKNFHDAEDVLHDCYISVYVNAPAYVSEKKPLAWILTIARNLCYKKLQTRKRTDYLDSEEAERFFTEHALPAGDVAEDRFFIEECVNNLGDEERDVLILHAVAGMKFREISAFLGVPLPTVLSRYNRTVKKLRIKYGSTEL